MRFWLALTGFLIFAAGAAVGFAASRGMRPGTTAAALSDAFLDMPTFLIGSENVYDQLDLTEAQRENVNALIGAHHREVSRKRDEISRIVTGLYDDFEALLSGDQRKRFDEIQAIYTEREIQTRVRHEILSLSDDMELSPEQEARAYMILYDAALARREAWKSCKEKAGEVSRDQMRDLMRAMMAEISARRDASLEEVFSPDQWAAYRERKERERKLWERKRDKGPDRDGGAR